MRKVIRTSAAPVPRGAYSQAIATEEFVFVAGQAAIDPLTNELELGDIRSETRRTLENIRAILGAEGCSLQDVVRVGVFLANIEDFSGMNDVYREFFPVDPPPRTTVGVQLPGFKVEIDCIATLTRAPKRRHRQ